MIAIRSFEKLMTLDAPLIKILSEACPWLTCDWNPYDTGIVYILQDNDSHMNWIVTQPDYRDRMSIKMATHQLWKPPAIFNGGYWNVVAIFDQDYEGTFFLSAAYVQSILGQEEILQEIKRTTKRKEQQTTTTTTTTTTTKGHLLYYILSSTKDLFMLLIFSCSF